MKFKGKIIKDWGAVNFRDPEHLKKFRGAMNAFLAAPDRNVQLKAAMQHFATKGDFPAEILQILEKFHATTHFDTSYEQIFDIRDFTSSQVGGFDILDVSSGLTFAKVPTGGKAKVFKFSGSKATVTFDKYGGALGWDKVLIDDAQYWTLEDNAVEFRNKYYAMRAQAFYDLIDAVGSGENVSWQAVEPVSVPSTAENYNAIRDVITIETACQTILTDCKNKGYGVTPQSQFYILAPVQLRSRILRALSIVQQAFAGSTARLTYNVTPIWTLMLSATDKYYVVLPKQKMKGGYRMDLTLFNETNILEYTETVAGWCRFGGAIGDTDQVKRCSIA